MTTKQLTFSTVLDSKLAPVLQIPPNRSVKLEDRLRLSRQAKAIYELLQAGPVKTSELAAIGLQYNARLSEVRHFLVKQGKFIDVIEGENGENMYEIVLLGRSTFWQKVKDKEEVWKWL